MTARMQVDNAVLLGYGSIGRRHARILARRYAHLAIVDRSETARFQAQSDLPAARVADSLADLDGTWQWEMTVGVIATWGPSHAALFFELARRAVAHVLCEKPLANSVFAAREMVEAAEKDGVALGTNIWRRYAGMARAVNALAASHDLGPPVRLVAHGGALCLVTTGIHYIDLARQLFGQAAESVISTARGQLINPRSGDLGYYGGTAVWSFGGGREAVMSFSNESRVAGSIFVYYRDAILDLTGTSVALVARPPEEIAARPSPTWTGKASKVLYEGPLPGVLPVDDAIAKALDEVETRRVISLTPRESLDAVAACIAALTAGRDGTRVPLPIDAESEAGRAEWPIS